MQVVIDRTKFHHNDWLGTTIFDLAKALPHPELPSWDDRDTWLHKNAQGLKFYRPLWTRYPEPCYWTVAKIKIKKKPVRALRSESTARLPVCAAQLMQARMLTACCAASLVLCCSILR